MPTVDTMDDDVEAHIEDISTASTIPTDLSISEISDLRVDKRNPSKKHKQKLQQKEKDKISRQLLEKKQLEHDLQLLKIELKQKDYLVENIRTEYQLKVEDLEEKLQECRHQRQLIQAKSESELHIHKVRTALCSNEVWDTWNCNFEAHSNVRTVWSPWVQ